MADAADRLRPVPRRRHVRVLLPYLENASPNLLCMCAAAAVICIPAPGML